MEAIKKDVKLNISPKMEEAFRNEKFTILFTNQMNASPFLNHKDAVYYTEVLYKPTEKSKSLHFGFFHNNTEKDFAKSWRSQISKRWLYVGLDEYPNIMKRELGMSTKKQYDTMVNRMCNVADTLRELAKEEQNKGKLKPASKSAGKSIDNER